MMIWDLEDSYSDDQQDDVDEVVQEIGELADSDKDSSDDIPTSLLCLICNESFDSPEATQMHVLKTLHEDYEMVELANFSLEMSSSLKSFTQNPDIDDWELILKQEMETIFQMQFS